MTILNAAKEGKQMYGLYQDGKGLIEIDFRQNWIQARFDELVIRFQGQSHPYWIETHCSPRH